MRKIFGGIRKPKIILTIIIIAVIITIVLVLKFSCEDKKCLKKEKVKEVPKTVKVIKQPVQSTEPIIKKKEIEKKEEISKKIISEKVPSKKAAPKKVISKKTTPKKTTLKKVAPKKIIPERTKSFSLNLEEKEFLVEELKKHSYPESQEEEEKLFNIIELLKESGSLSEYNNLLCAIAVENLNHETFGALISEKAICYLAKIGSTESIPTLLWVFVNTDDSFEREITKKAIKAIKEGKKIDLKSLFSDRVIYSKFYNEQMKRLLEGLKPVPVPISKKSVDTEVEYKPDSYIYGESIHTFDPNAPRRIRAPSALR